MNTSDKKLEEMENQSNTNLVTQEIDTVNDHNVSIIPKDVKENSDDGKILEGSSDSDNND